MIMAMMRNATLPRVGPPSMPQACKVTMLCLHFEYVTVRHKLFISWHTYFVSRWHHRISKPASDV